MQLWKLKAIMDFYLAKHGLNKHGISEDQIWSPKREREPYREGVKREREKKKKKNRKIRRREGEKFKQAKRYGTTWAFKALNGFPCNCIVISCLQT